MFYKNTSYFAKTFYGVTFNPGETKEVDGIINNKYLIKVDKPVSVTNKAQQKPSPEAKKDVPKEESKKEEKAPKESSEKTEQKS